MQKYELVLLLDVAVKDSERKDFLWEFEKKFADNVKDKDEIGVQTLMYDLFEVKWNNKAYLVSYYLDLDPTQVKEVKKFFLYNKMVLKHEILSMKASDIFLHFEKNQKELEDIMEKWDNKRIGNKVTFFSKKENAKYINRKSVVMLKKYVTRFGSIKPRKYTKNGVLVQKALRTQLIRARNFGVIDFIKK